MGNPEVCASATSSRPRQAIRRKQAEMGASRAAGENEMTTKRLWLLLAVIMTASFAVL